MLFRSLALDLQVGKFTSKSLKDSIALVKYIRESHLLMRLFDSICSDKHGRTFSLILFTWSSAKMMFAYLLKVKSVLYMMPGVAANENIPFDQHVLLWSKI